MRKIFLSIFTIISLSLGAQHWATEMDNKEKTVQEIQQSFEQYWTGRSIEKGKGYKQFRRWEYMVEQRTYPDGKFVRPDLAWKETLKFREENKATRHHRSNPNWISLGPDSWINGPSGYNPGLGRINVVQVDPNNENIIYVGTPSGGLWRSTNGGTSWASLTDDLPVIGVSGIAIHPANSDVIYIATGDGYASDNYSIGVLKSTDGGQSWNTTGLTFEITQSRTIAQLIIDPENPETLIAAANNGIFKTIDGGVNWSQRATGNRKALVFKPGDSQVVYAAGTNIIRSTNNGETWTTISQGVPNNAGRIALAVTPANPDFVYALACNNSDFGFLGLFRSTDSGQSFTLRSSTPNILGNNLDGSDEGGQGWYDLAIAASPTNADEIYTGGINIWKSVNGGATFNINTHWVVQTLSHPYVHADIHYLGYHNSVLYTGCDGGIYRTTNGGAIWNDLTSGMAITQIYRIGASLTNPNIVQFGAQDNGSNRSSAINWMHIFGADGMETIIDYTNPDFTYISYQNGGLLRSNNGGSTFDNFLNGVNEEGAWVTPYLIHPINPQTFWAGLNQVWRTNDRGNFWEPLGGPGAGRITALAVAPANTNVIYYSKNSTLYRTTNGGSTWANISQGLPNLFITYIEVDPQNPQNVYVTMSGYSQGNKVFKSTNSGNNWQNISLNLPNLPVNCILFEKDSPEGLYIGTDVGVYYKNQSMNHWVSYSEGLPNVIVMELEIHYPTSKLRAGTYGRGLWEADLFQLNNMPIANFTSSNTDICPNNTVTFQNASFNNSQVVQWIFEGGVPQTSTISNPTVTYPNSGQFDVSLIVQNDNGIDTLTIPNFVNVIQPQLDDLPYFQDFQNIGALPSGWQLVNFDGLITWEKVNLSGNWAMMVRNYEYETEYQKDQFITNHYSVEDNLIGILKFDVAYSSFPGFADSLNVYFSNDCNESKTRVYSKGGNVLRTTPTTIQTFFVPSATDWRTETVEISGIAANQEINFTFENISGQGNNLYIDNISFEWMSLVENLTPNITVTIHPNPFTHRLRIIIPTESANLQVKSVNGSLLKNILLNTKTSEIDLADLSDGIYFVELKIGDKIHREKIIKTHR